MDYHIIAIFGKAGSKDKLASYSKDSVLKIDELKNGEFHNSTHCLIESFGDGATYTFLGTSESINHHKDIFVNLPQCKAIFDKYPPVESSDIEDIFHQILESIKSAKENNIILDITHGFRHYHIIASFASTLGQINTKKSITLLFAKEIEQGKKYQYISLEKYSQISLIALSLQTFVQTLSVPNMGLKEPFIIALSEFSKSLHANAFNEIFANLDKAKSALQNAKNSDSFKGLDNILSEVESILSVFDDIKITKENYKKYYKFARLMCNKRYYLISATYISEAILLYALEGFKHKGFIEKSNRENTDSSHYYITSAIQSFVFLCQIQTDDEIYKRKKSQIYKKCRFYFNEDEFDALESDIRENKMQEILCLQDFITRIKNIRNDLVHINASKDNNISAIPSQMQTLLKDFKEKCLDKDFLKNL